MKKFYLIIVLLIGGYFYVYPGQFDMMRSEAGVKAEQTIGEAQAQALNGINEAQTQALDGVNNAIKKVAPQDQR